MESADEVVGREAFEEVDGVPVVSARRRAITQVRERLAAVPVVPAVSAAAGGIVVGAAAAGLARQKRSGRTLLPAKRSKPALDSGDALQLTRIVTTRTVQVTVHTLLPAARQR
jgi:hypothetical protein